MILSEDSLKSKHKNIITFSMESDYRGPSKEGLEDIHSVRDADTSSLQEFTRSLLCSWNYFFLSIINRHKYSHKTLLEKKHRRWVCIYFGKLQQILTAWWLVFLRNCTCEISQFYRSYCCDFSLCESIWRIGFI